jgi:hypothetical protein
MGSWTHKPEKRAASKRARRSVWATIRDEVTRALRSRTIDRGAKVNEAGDTYWPDSETPAVKEG